MVVGSDTDLPFVVVALGRVYRVVGSGALHLFVVLGFSTGLTDARQSKLTLAEVQDRRSAGLDRAFCDRGRTGSGPNPTSMLFLLSLHKRDRRINNGARTISTIYTEY